MPIMNPAIFSGPVEFVINKLRCTCNWESIYVGRNQNRGATWC